MAAAADGEDEFEAVDQRLSESQKFSPYKDLELKCTRCIMQMTACTRQTYPSKTFTNSLNMQKHYEKNVWETSNDTYSLSVRVQTTINHISIVFYHNINVKENVFFQSAS